jgi:hypothetical protein
MGDLALQPVSTDVLTRIDRSTLFLPSKRLIFTGWSKNTTIRLPRVLDFDVHDNGIRIQKDTGKNPFLAFASPGDIETGALILQRLLDEG